MHERAYENGTNRFRLLARESAGAYLPLAAVSSGRSDLVTLAATNLELADFSTGLDRVSASTGAFLPELPAFSKAVGRTSRNCTSGAKYAII